MGQEHFKISDRLVDVSIVNRKTVRAFEIDVH